MNSKNITDRYFETVGNLLNSSVVQSMKQYNHHGPIDTHFHSVHVSYYVYKICDSAGYSDEYTSEITSAALLHDLYLYNWYTDKHDEYHAFYHPKEAVKNIRKYSLLNLTDMQREMILRHMFPLGRFPNSKGGWILTACDKYCAAKELLKKTAKFEKIYNDIDQRTTTNDR